MKTKRKFTVAIERDENANDLASVPALRGCYTHAGTLDTLMKRIREAIKPYFEVGGQDEDP
jgi:predicted RNase H-like HicB family nuclease